MPTSHPQILSLAVSLLAGALVIAVRLRGTSKPTTLRKIVAPPFGMATGFLMFVVPAMRVPWLWGLAAFAVGAVFFSYPLILTSRFEVVNGEIYLKRSKMFVVIIVVLLVVRILLHDVVERHVTIPQTGALFFLLAFGMLLPWRIAMARGFIALKRKLDAEPQA
jgi:membrane protein CcdC involved in cytochrome C biogenesis